MLPCSVPPQRALPILICLYFLPQSSNKIVCSLSTRFARVVLRGRVASLPEVGTGFHPELTGRENMFLNGAILGMTRREIREKFDEIVAFAEVEKFIDTAVKRYSSVCMCGSRSL
jgi:ABC-type polysaccharide/polyol phosphate transport system ATPase subunit